MLTENQKIELHNQALKYLQHYTRRCVSCGEGQFAKLLGKTSNKEDRKKKMADIDEMFELDYNDEAVNKEDKKGKLKCFEKPYQLSIISSRVTLIITLSNREKGITFLPEPISTCGKETDGNVFRCRFF